LEENNLPKVDAIIHLAGKAHDTKNQAEAKVYFDINTGLTQKAFDYFLKSDATKFVFFSTMKAAADKAEGDFLTEEIIPKPVGPYGESKIKAEEYIKSRLEVEDNSTVFNSPKYLQKQVYIVRPCMIHGPGNKGNLNLLYNVVKKGVPWPLGAFENRRTFTSIDNLCFAINGLLTQDVHSGIYHIGDDESLSTNELINVICQATGHKAHIWRINKGFITWCARVGGVLHLPLNPERLRKLTENYVVSNTKIKKALAIEAFPVRANDGLIKTLKSFENNG